jgi:hypothetical protein
MCHFFKIEDGAFDGLVRLRVLDVRENFNPGENKKNKNFFSDTITSRPNKPEFPDTP